MTDKQIKELYKLPKWWANLADNNYLEIIDIEGGWELFFEKDGETSVYTLSDENELTLVSGKELEFNEFPLLSKFEVY
jgi:hypothetical protein